ncbi:hypothetical protein V2J09_023856 [Rumex salicifolius]
MLCACSGEQFKFEEPPPKSPESLATKDFSVSGHSPRTPRDFSTVSGVSSRTPRDFSASGLLSASGTADQLASKLEDDQVDEVESTLKEALSLNYEEARALLGRMEYQKANFSAAIQLFQGIDISRLTPSMIKSIREHSRQKKPKSKGGANAVAGIISMASVSLFLEAILLKTKTLQELGRTKEAANECKIILDVVESALPNGMSKSTPEDSKMQEMFHKALELLPELWKQAGHLDEAITSYRRALVKPWNLDPSRLAAVQKELAATLLYGGVETGLPLQLQIWGPTTPKNNLEEAILLLSVLIAKMADQEIGWDLEVVDHLTFGLSVCEGFEFLADHMEQVFPGIYDRSERWYILALCYSACGQNEVALNLLNKVGGMSEMSKHKPLLSAFLLGAKLSSQNPKHAHEGIEFARRFIESASDGDEHFLGQAHKFMGICYGNSARSAISSSERDSYQNESLRSLNSAFSVDKDDPELIFNLGLENAVQRNLNSALEYTMLCSSLVGESWAKAWKLLALVLSAQHRFKDAETVIQLASNEGDEMDHLELLRLKANLQVSQQQPRQAIETYGVLLSQIQALRRSKFTQARLKVLDIKHLEVEAWHGLANLYTKLEAWSDAEICVEKTKSIETFDPRSWHAKGVLMQAKSEYKEALVAFLTSLAMEPDHVPSLVSMAEVLMQLGTHLLSLARGFLMNALQIDPTNHDAWFNLGLISKREGQLTQAADYFQAALELSSSAPIQPFTKSLH